MDFLSGNERRRRTNRLTGARVENPTTVSMERVAETTDPFRQNGRGPRASRGGSAGRALRPIRGYAGRQKR